MRRLAVGAGLMLLTACSAGTSTPVTAPLPSRATVPGAAVTTELSSRSIGRLGDVLADAAGRTVYANSQEPADAQACATECQRTWPLLLAPTTGLPTVSGSAKESLLGSVTAGSRRVLTYAGHPLHEYVGDPTAGDAFGQGVQGVWSAVTVAGAPAVGSP